MNNIENNLFNGRVNLLTKGYPDYNTCKNSTVNDSTDAHDMISRNMEHTPVSSLFFSKQNINALQQGICNKVYNDSRGKYNIGKQSETELKIIMRSTYFNSLKNNFFIQFQNENYNGSANYTGYDSDPTVSQVRILNKAVLDWAVPQIITNIQQFEKYKQDVSMLPNPMDRPSLTSMAGTKSLEFQSFF